MAGRHPGARAPPFRSAPPAPPKPSLLAPGYEKAFHKAIHTFARGDVPAAVALFEESSAKDTGEKALADDLFAGLLNAQLGNDDAAIRCLEKVVRSDQSLPDELMDKYVAGAGIAIGHRRRQGRGPVRLARRRAHPRRDLPGDGPPRRGDRIDPAAR